MLRKLDDLDEASFLERPGDHEPCVGQLLAKPVVYLIAVTMALVHHYLVVCVASSCAGSELDCLGAEAHRPAEILDFLLLRQQIDDGKRCLRIHLGGVRALEPADVSSELGDGDVHPEADAEVRDLALARDLAGRDLRLPTA